MDQILSGEGTHQNIGEIGCMLIQTAETDNCTDEFMENYNSMSAGVQCPIIDLPE